jgi:hypothetical protein
MHPHAEKRLSRDEVKRIAAAACLRARQKEDIFYNLDILDALAELTGLEGREVAALAGETGRSGSNRFFSIRQQLLLASGFLLLFPVAPLIWLWMRH